VDDSRLVVFPTETKDICRDRAERMPHSPGIEPGAGRGFTVHHHGEASTSDMDGWAEQYICAGETKVVASSVALMGLGFYGTLPILECTLRC
jgi:hypothetical protein